jgi:hypothetical protein
LLSEANMWPRDSPGDRAPEILLWWPVIAKKLHSSPWGLYQGTVPTWDSVKGTVIGAVHFSPEHVRPVISRSEDRTCARRPMSRDRAGGFARVMTSTRLHGISPRHPGPVCSRNVGCRRAPILCAARVPVFSIPRPLRRRAQRLPFAVAGGVNCIGQRHWRLERPLSCNRLEQ